MRNTHRRPLKGGDEKKGETMPTTNANRARALKAWRTRRANSGQTASAGASRSETMNGEVHQARKQDIPCFYARLSENLMGARKNGTLVTLTKGDKSIKVPAFVLPSTDSRDGSGQVLLPKSFRLALSVDRGDSVTIQ